MPTESEPLEAAFVNDEKLAAFQAALLDLLVEPLSPEEIMQRLQEDAKFAPFKNYIATFEPRMVEVAAHLVKKWGRRSGDEIQQAEPVTNELGHMPH